MNDDLDEVLDLLDAEDDVPPVELTRTNESSGTPSSGLKRGEKGPTKSQVEPGQSAIVPAPDDNQSLLSVEALQKLAADAEYNEQSLPASFLSNAAPHLHNTHGIVDFATTVCLAVARGEIQIKQSAELRKWAELMYTCVVASQPNQNNVQVNYVEQLIQLAGGEEAMQPEVLDVRDAITASHPTPRKKAQGE